MQSKHILKSVGIALLFCLMYCQSSTVFAESRTYDVQVLVFSHITPQTIQLQRWPAIPAAPTTNGITPTHTAYDLQHEKKILERNPNYKILFDGSFQETWHAENTTITLPIISNTPQSALSGAMQITLAHYFDVHTNLILSEQTSTLAKIANTPYFSQWSQPTFRFQLLQDRRMRSDELNYLEHPLIGVLIKIIRVNEK